MQSDTQFQRAHLREQALRFARLFGAAVVVQLAALQGQGVADWKKAGVAALVAAAETAYRQWRPALSQSR